MKKLTVEECERISISTIYHHVIWFIDKHFPVISSSEFNAILDQRLEDMSKSSIRVMGSLVIILEKTSANLGGMRYWFICPYCNRRIGTLYKPNYEKRFKCRHCYNLIYKSTQTHDHRVNSILKLVSKHPEYASQIARTKPRLFLKVYDKHRLTFPSPRSIRYRKEEEAYNKYIKPLLGN